MSSERVTATILVAEDDAGLRRLIDAILGPAGYELLFASDGDEAFELGCQHLRSLDLALLDLVLPGRRGDEVMAALRELRPQLPVLLTSGHAPEDLRLAQDASTKFLRKPFLPDDLLDAVGELLGDAKA